MEHRRGTTIAAVATAAGEGAIAIVRLSGPAAFEIARVLSGREPRPRCALLCTFRDSAGAPLDRGLLLAFPAPNSYTGEDLVELHAHGGGAVSAALLERVLELGAVPAEPGEFTLRAFLNDKLDLAQAEAVADLIGASSRRAAQAALRSLDGEFSASVTELQNTLTDIRAHAEAWLDFPDEELPLEDARRIAERLAAAERSIAELTRGAARGAMLRDGLAVVIAGAPNAGKSSLLNRLAGYDAAIVTEVAGTTRDTLREHLSLDGLPVTVIDTAGLRAAADPIEHEGVRRAQAAIAKADRVLWVADIRDGGSHALAAARATIPAGVPLTLLLNKADLLAALPAPAELEGVPVLALSALTGTGLDALVEHLKKAAGWSGEVAGAFSARRRHVVALERAGARLAAARRHRPRALELAAEELRAAQRDLSELTGEHTSDDLLGAIFASFCIGK